MSDGGRAKVVEFYRGTTVLMTGASGFVGQVLLEKILRCLDVSKVYLVIRAKKNLSGEARLERILSSPLFDGVRNDASMLNKLRRKVIPVELCLDSGFNFADEDLKCALQEQVEVVFNLLASVNFKEPLDCALKTNVDRTDQLLGLVNGMKRLKSVVHVSTFYSNCDKSFIGERIYDDIDFGGCENIMNIMSHLREPEKETLTEHIVKNFPNTYTFSKKCAEVMIRDKYQNLPIGVFRPPIVTSTYREPVPGWIDNFNGPSGMVVPLSEGLYSVAFVDGRKRPFIVPVDYCVNALITCAMDVYANHRTRMGIPVYNYVNTGNNPTWGTIIGRFCEGLSPAKRFMATYLTATITRNPLRYAICKRTMLLQGLLLDLARRIGGKRPILGPMFEKMINLSEVLQFFCINEWRTENGNVQRMRAEQSSTERNIFPFDLAEVDWDEYYRNFVPGVMKYAIEPRKARDVRRQDSENWIFLMFNFVILTLVNFIKLLFGPKRN
ncbi:fatty acyl-CoA reductase wat-like [Toxorhynchites rutilus septentrionalis]|uniref:fatty acyl-CoA reductase wat-like n=1 Tax=Toxorhynchites rutilus septentrionalis TaxID=329112 RepID=UPI00247967FD|nr:fatty acyl-CoA reductase wat-like [Toxorhynchites rutilus septentrionalis]